MTDTVVRIMKDAEWRTPPRKARGFVGEIVWGPDRHGRIRRGRTIETREDNPKMAQVYWDDDDSGFWEYVVGHKLASTRDEAEKKLAASWSWSRSGTTRVRPLRREDDPGAERGSLSDDDSYLFFGQ